MNAIIKTTEANPYNLTPLVKTCPGCGLQFEIIPQDKEDYGFNPVWCGGKGPHCKPSKNYNQFLGRFCS